MSKVLIVSKQTYLSARLRLLLKVHGFTVEHATSLCKAWILLGQIRFKAVLVDSFLDDGSGIDFCSSIRKRSKDAPLILLGDITDVDKVARGKLSGVSDILQKPFTTRMLKTVMNRHIL